MTGEQAVRARFLPHGAWSTAGLYAHRWLLKSAACLLGSAACATWLAIKQLSLPNPLGQRLKCVPVPRAHAENPGLGTSEDQRTPQRKRAEEARLQYAICTLRGPVPHASSASQLCLSSARVRMDSREPIKEFTLMDEHQDGRASPNALVLACSLVAAKLGVSPQAVSSTAAYGHVPHSSNERSLPCAIAPDLINSPAASRAGLCCWAWLHWA